MREPINDKARLDLMKEAISNIEAFLEGTDSYESFSANKLLCHAVCYNLQCIGENSYRLSREYVEKHPQIDWLAIEGLRHILVHDYYTVNFKTVWNIVQTDLPKLKAYLANA